MLLAQQQQPNGMLTALVLASARFYGEPMLQGRQELAPWHVGVVLFRRPPRPPSQRIDGNQQLCMGLPSALSMSQYPPQQAYRRPAWHKESRYQLKACGQEGSINNSGRVLMECNHAACTTTATERRVRGTGSRLGQLLGIADAPRKAGTGILARWT